MRVSILHPTLRGILELDKREDFVNLLSGVRRRGSAFEDDRPRPSRMKVGGFEDGTDAKSGCLQLVVRLAEKRGVTARRLRETEQHSQRRRLAGTVGSRKPVIVPASMLNDRCRRLTRRRMFVNDALSIT